MKYYIRNANTPTTGDAAIVNNQQASQAYQNSGYYYRQSISKQNTKNEDEQEIKTNKRGSNVIED